MERTSHNTPPATVIEMCQGQLRVKAVNLVIMLKLPLKMSLETLKCLSMQPMLIKSPCLCHTPFAIALESFVGENYETSITIAKVMDDA